MALFIFVGDGVEISSLVSREKINERKSNYELTCIIHIGKEFQDHDICGIPVSSAADCLDGALFAKKRMDQNKLVKANCILPLENWSEFESWKSLIFPPMCEILVESFSKRPFPKKWEQTSKDIDNVSLLKDRLAKMEAESCVQTVKSRIIPSTIFIHGYSKRYGGISNFPGMKSLNLVYSLRKPDPLLVINENSKRLCDHVGVDHDKYYLAKANHGKKVWVFEKEPPESYDGIVTNTKGVTVASPAADCNMLLLADPSKKVCGAIHAGWKGLLAGIIKSAVDAMVSNYGCDPKNIVAALGPSLSVCCCEFGVADSKKFQSIGDRVVVWFEGKEKPHIDLRLAAKILLEKCAILTENIDDGINGAKPTLDIATCTKCDSNQDYFSFRRDGAKFGNQIAFISVKE